MSCMPSHVRKEGQKYIVSQTSIRYLAWCNRTIEAVAGLSLDFAILWPCYSAGVFVSTGKFCSRNYEGQDEIQCITHTKNLSSMDKFSVDNYNRICACVARKRGSTTSQAFGRNYESVWHSLPKCSTLNIYVTSYLARTAENVAIDSFFKFARRPGGVTAPGWKPIAWSILIVNESFWKRKLLTTRHVGVFCSTICNW